MGFSLGGYNAHGDVVQLTNAAGDVTRDYRYDAFGVEQNPDDTDTNPWRYCGEYFDREAGTVYLRARYYEPATSRMLSEDSLRIVSFEFPNGQKIPDVLSLNLYTYCLNNPVRFIDPTGHYNRQAAVDYALKYAMNDYKYAPFAYPGRFDNDCTNFASWVLKAGGIKPTDQWNYSWLIVTWWNGKVISSLSRYTLSWSMAKHQYNWITNPSNGYINGETIKIDSASNIAALIKDNNIQAGDLIYWRKDSGEVEHTSIIVSVSNGKITYAQHTSDKIDGDVGTILQEQPQYTLEIVRINDKTR